MLFKKVCAPDGDEAEFKVLIKALMENLYKIFSNWKPQNYPWISKLQICSTALART